MFRQHDGPNPWRTGGNGKPKRSKRRKRGKGGLPPLTKAQKARLDYLRTHPGRAGVSNPMITAIGRGYALKPGIRPKSYWGRERRYLKRKIRNLRTKYRPPAERTLYQPMRHKWTSRISAMRRKGVCVETDYIDNISAPVVAGKAGSVYIGHYTHPAQQVVYAICMAWAKFIAVKCSGHVPATVDEPIGGPQASGSGGLVLEINYRHAPELNDIKTDSTITISHPTETVKTLAVKLQTVMYNLQKNLLFAVTGTDGPEIRYESFAIVGNGGTDPFDNKRYNMHWLSVGVRGSSSLKMCNVSTATVHDSTGGTDEYSRDHILHVPLQCRAYAGKGSLFKMKHRTLTASQAEGQISFNDITGLEEFNDTDAASAEVDAVLKYPPKYAVWYGAKAQGNGFMLNPGKFTTSHMVKTHVLSFNQWANVLRRVLARTVGLGGATNPKTSIGLAKWYGFHKKFEHSTGINITPSPVTVDYEHHLKFTSLMTYKRRPGFTATDPVLQT